MPNIYHGRYGSTSVNFNVKFAIAIIIAIAKWTLVAFYIVTYRFIYREPEQIST